MLRWFPRFQVATTCFSCSPPDLNLAVTNFIFCVHVKYPLPPGDNPIVVNKYIIIIIIIISSRSCGPCTLSIYMAFESISERNVLSLLLVDPNYGLTISWSKLWTSNTLTCTLIWNCMKKIVFAEISKVKCKNPKNFCFQHDNQTIEMLYLRHSIWTLQAASFFISSLSTLINPLTKNFSMPFSSFLLYFFFLMSQIFA